MHLVKCLALRCYAFYIDAFDQNPFEATVAKKMPLLCYFNFNPKFNPFSFTTKIAHGDLQAQNQTTESENEILVIFEYILEVLECFAKKQTLANAKLINTSHLYYGYTIHRYNK